ncbi:YihY/virulence factor BrkB family protein [Brachybacterium sp. EF45031]|nr:YihY/virulence factor BrkB family protein [Brachybacterium sillae]
MTFYTLLSVFPAAVALVSTVSLMGLEDTAVAAITGLATEIFPTLDGRLLTRALLALGGTRGGVLGLLLGTLGAVLSASNGVAAFHRAMHRVYDTREGRPFLWFRLIVFGETLVIIATSLLVVAILVLGSEASQRLGDLVGVPRAAFVTWNLVKWPLLLAILTIGVSLAYYLFPNVQLPRYRIMTLGSVLSVLTLFLAALALGRLLSWATRFGELITSLNGLIGILVLIWLANIVIVTGAALDAEFLRARQIAQGREAWAHIDLPPQSSHALDFLRRDAEQVEELSRDVVESVRTGEPLVRPRSPWVVDARSPFAVNPPAGRPGPAARPEKDA